MAFDITTAVPNINYTAAGGQTVFSVPFGFFANADLAVYDDGVFQTLNVHYTVTGAGVTGGGAITFATGRTLDAVIHIHRTTPNARTSAYVTGGGLAANALETDLDKLVCMSQEQETRLSRTVHSSALEGVLAELPLKTARSGKFLYFDPAGNPTAVTGDPTQPLTVYYQSYTALGGEGAVTTLYPYTPGAHQLWIFVNGEIQEPAVDYLETDTDTITFTTPLIAGDTVLLLTGSIFDVANVVLFEQTANEAASGIVPTNTDYPPGDSRRYGVVSDGATDNAVALQDWLKAAAGDVEARLYNFSGIGSILCGAMLSVPENSHIRIQPGVVLEATLDDTPLLQGLGVTDVSIDGGEILGVQGTVHWPNPTTNSEGLVHFTVNGATQCERIRIANCHIHRTWAPISCIKVKKLWIEGNECHDYMRYGILASSSVDFNIDGNTVYGSNIADDDNAYGIMATGNEAAGFIQARSSITNNKVYDVPSWSGIMAHDVASLIVGFNQIENVRLGVDIGALTDANVINDIIVTGNAIKLTSTNTWGATAGSHMGIHVTGRVGGDNHARVVISGNIIKDYGTMAGATYAGNPGPISVAYVDSVAITGNIVRGVDDVSASAKGIRLIGEINAAVVSGNSLQGAMAGGAIRVESVTTSDAITIVGNTIVQETATDPAVQITGSTLSKLAVADNATNSTAPLVVSTSTVTYEGEGNYTGTLTGCTTSPTGTIEYSIDRDGGSVTLEIPDITATSNTTACTVTGMPTAIRPTAAQSLVGITTDNGVTAFGKVIVETSGTLTLHVAQSATFTNSGTKGINACSVSYRLH